MKRALLGGLALFLLLAAGGAIMDYTNTEPPAAKNAASEPPGARMPDYRVTWVQKMGPEYTTLAVITRPPLSKAELVLIAAHAREQREIEKIEVMVFEDRAHEQSEDLGAYVMLDSLHRDSTAITVERYGPYK